MSASAWDRAVEELAKAVYGMAWDQPPEAWEAAWRADGSDEYAGFATRESERDEARTGARVALAAALPVLLEELAQHIEAQGRDEVAWLADHASDRIDRARLIGSEDAWKSAIRVVRGFAAEVTQ